MVKTLPQGQDKLQLVLSTSTGLSTGLSKEHEVMQPGDNPPIGLLLCTDYNETLVKYSTEGLEDIYVGKYMLQLPSEETIRQYLIDNMPDPKQLENR